MGQVSDKQDDKRSIVLIPLIAITALFLLGVFFFVLGTDRQADPIRQGVNRADNTSSSEQQTTDTVNFEQAVSQYAQLLPETARESVDVQSVEGVAAQEVLLQQTGIVARSLSGNVIAIDGEAVPIAQITEALTNFNKSILDYGIAARAGLVDQTKVDAAAIELSNALNTKSGNDKKELDDLLTSYKNAVMESVRNFAQGDYKVSYQKQLESQQTATELFALIRDK